MSAVRKIALIGAPLDLGQGRRGVDMGPSALRYAGLLDRLAEIGHEVVDWGNIETAILEASSIQDERAKYLPEIKAAGGRIARLVRTALAEGFLPLVLGGDQSISLGTLGGISRDLGVGGLLWFDAHADMNTPDTSPTGNVHGMSLAAALGLGGEIFESDEWTFPALDPSRVALIGIRSLDASEKPRLRDLGARVYTMSDVDRIGIERAVRESLTHVAGAGFVHVSLDLDVLDPEVAPGVGTPVKGGLSYREAHLALELVAESGLMGSMEVVEVNPMLDTRNATAELAVELVASALGKTIL